MTSRAASALLLVLFLSVTTWAAPACLVQEVEDREVFVVHPGQASCEWPKGTVVIHGRLIFPKDTRVEFVGTTVVRANAIVVEQGATLKGAAATLRALTIIATN